MDTFRRVVLSVAAILISHAAMAATDVSAVGVWQTIDDETGKPASIVRIVDNNGVLQGKVEKILREGVDPNERCDKCEGADKDKPVVGMTILKGFKRKPDSDEYNDGTVLDPHNGKTYSGRITVDEDGRKLSLRGYIGISLIGRSQTWIRQ